MTNSSALWVDLYYVKLPGVFCSVPIWQWQGKTREKPALKTTQKKKPHANKKAGFPDRF